MDNSVRFGAIAPVVPAVDMERSLQFYVKTLGFAEVFRQGDPIEYAGVHRGLARLHLFKCADENIAKWTSFRISVSDIDAMFVRCTAAGVVHPNGTLSAKPWGSREFAVLDPAGICITLWESADEKL